MRPMELDVIRDMIVLLGGAPKWGPQATPFDTDNYDHNHPLVQWVDQLPAWQRGHLYLYNIDPYPTTQEQWNEAWAVSIYNALWS